MMHFRNRLEKNREYILIRSNHNTFVLISVLIHLFEMSWQLLWQTKELSRQIKMQSLKTPNKETISNNE